MVNPTAAAELEGLLRGNLLDPEDMRHVKYSVEGAVATIALDRPERANAQNERSLVELDHAWSHAERDRAVRVIILRANGKHFSAGHDMDMEQESSFVLTEGRYRDIAEYYDWEHRVYLHFAMRWRDIPKPSIAVVQGACIGAGLMLCWPCDLIVAADDARFSDPVVHMGMPAVEFTAHPYEFGFRKAKELLFTGRALSAAEAERIGMVNRVVPRDELDATAQELAAEIALRNPFALRLIKRTVNGAQDAQGFRTAVASGFDMHHLGHGNAMVVTEGADCVLSDLEHMKAQVKDEH